LEPSGDAVKEAKLVGKSPGGRLGRWFEGWEAGAITVALVLSAALLAVPRAAQPREFPVPLVDVAEAKAIRQRLGDLADAAERDGLPFETRAVGDAVRRWGSALATGLGDADYLNRLTHERVQAALLANQQDGLVRLRAVQSRLFVRAVREFGWGGPVPAELRELGGDFAERARSSGWIERGQCIASDDELATLFGLRWLELTHLLDDAHFRPTLGELRRYYRFLLLYPEHGSDLRSGPPAARRLRYAEALAKRDGDYPIDLVRGILQLQLENRQAAARRLSLHLGRPQAGWQLLARNYLLFAAGGQAAPESDSPFADPP
jgi:hypothetical protein